MSDAPVGMTEKSAAKIMGRSCITIEEALELFPEAKSWVNPDDYRQIPFSPDMIYHLSEHPWKYVLFPAFACRMKHGFLSVKMIQEFFQNRFPEVNISTIGYQPAVNLFAKTDTPTNYKPLYRIAAYALNNHFPPPKWLLLTSQALKLGVAPLHRTISNAPDRIDKIERSIVYIYAWLLYWRLRGRSIFNGRPFACGDLYAQHKSREPVVLKFGDAEIAIGQMDTRLRPQIGLVRSLLPPEDKKDPQIKSPD